MKMYKHKYSAATPTERFNKPGWHDTHYKHCDLVTRSQPSLLLIGDSIVAGLSRYRNVWNKNFKEFNTINCGISGDKTQHVLWRANNICVPLSVKHIVVHCGTNNLDHNSPNDISNAIMEIGKTLRNKTSNIQIILTGILPRDINQSSRRNKIVKINGYLKQLCKSQINIYFMEQDRDWIYKDNTLNKSLYYKDNLHL